MNKKPEYINSSIQIPIGYILPIIVISFTALNGFYNSLAAALGFDFPYNTFCFSPNDLFADFIKSVLSFPGPRIEHSASWSPLYKSYLEHNPYIAITSLKTGQISNLHGMPVTTLIFLFARFLFNFLNPNLVFTIFLVVIILPFLIWMNKYMQIYRRGYFFIAAFIFSYPMIFGVTRGNVSAIFLGEILIIAILLVFDKKNMWGVIFLLALAMNIKPNTIIFLLLPLISYSVKQSIKYAIKILILATIIYLVAFWIVHKIYPDYSFANFAIAIKAYKNIYVVNNEGLAYGSSLFGGIKMVGNLFSFLIDNVKVELYLFILCGAFVLTWLVKVINKKLDKLAATFLLIAIYTLFSEVFADYHLLVFWAPAILIIRSGCNPLISSKESIYWIFIGSVLMLSAKNYFFFEQLSAQVIINPLILGFIGVLLLFVKNSAEGSLVDAVTVD